MEKLLKRRLNPFLLISTVLVLGLLAGLSVVYQSQLSDLVSDRSSLQEEVDQKENRIQGLEANLSDLRQRTSSLNSTLEETNQIVQEERRLKQQKEERVNQLEDQVSDLSATVETQNTTIQSLETNNTRLREDWSLMNSTLEDVCDSAENQTVVDQCDDWGF